MVSQHSTDRLIRHLAQASSPATRDEAEQIITRMAEAPFDRREVPVPTRLRGLTDQGHVLTARCDSLVYHLIKRTLDERQWADGTTHEEYLADLRRVVCHSASRLAVYERRGGFMAVALAQTMAAVPLARQAVGTLPHLLVVYSAEHGMIVTGYQVSSLDLIGIPEAARWLK